MARKKTRASSDQSHARRGGRGKRARPVSLPGAEEVEDPPPLPGPDFPIVGIGASAGGLEAFTQLLGALPRSTGMGFVLIQHLAPLHKSMLSEILSGTTGMRVEEVKEGMRVERDRVYVIPPNSSMGIFHGVLHLVPRTDAGGKHMPIDYFLKSLAEDQRGRSIGVILAGTATDGSVGLKAIKAEGGITLAQDPGTAKYDGMPRAAIASGAVDFVLPPEGIAKELANIGAHPYLRNPVEPRIADPQESDEHLHKVFFLLKRSCGVDFTYYKRATIRRRIQRRMVVHKVDVLTDYVAYLEEHPEEIERLYQDILIHVTSFFRGPDLFEHLKQFALPSILKDRADDVPLRLWVPGCSTGEEAYSLAMSLIEFLDDHPQSPPIQIFASDISQLAIDKARSGFYPQNIEADVSPERIRRFFTKADGGYRISQAVRDLCVFAKQDMTKDPPFSKLDLITCRNVLIYLGPTLQKRVLTIFHFSLKPSGFLVLGPSETIGSFEDYFTLSDKRHKIYRRKSTLMRPGMDFPLHHVARMDAAKQPAFDSRSRGDVAYEVDRIILDRFAPAGVVLNSDFQIVQFRGQTGNYLEPAPGVATLNVLKMAREGLMLELRSALHAARRKNVAARGERVAVKQAHGMGEVNFEVIPLPTQEGDKHYLLLFWDAMSKRRTSNRDGGKGKLPRNEKPSGRMDKLEHELKTTRQYLESIIQDMEATNEELQSANEEILSSNEELQSTNEELETAKEELQSTNEELNTVNEELQTRNQELSQLNSDLGNLLANVQIPIIMVGNDLRIRRITPMAEKLFNLIPGDLGRPIGDIKQNQLEIEDLERLIAESIDSVSLREVEVKDRTGRRYALRIRPYKNLQNRIDGAVLALLDRSANG